MTDTSQPSTPAEFTAAGATPAQAAVLCQQHEALAGRAGPDAKAAMSIAARDAPPALAPPPARSGVTQAEAQHALDAHTESQLSQELAASFAPPAQASEYRFPDSIEPQNEAAWAADNELKAALHTEGFPRFIVESIGTALANAAATRLDETPEQAQQRVGSVRATLQGWYGKDTDANLALADRLIEQLRAKGGAVSDFVEAAAPHLDALSLDSLIQFAKQKQRAGRR